VLVEMLDPDFRRVRREHLVQTGKKIRLKHDVDLFARRWGTFPTATRFPFYVISAAPGRLSSRRWKGLCRRTTFSGRDSGTTRQRGG